jgi:hypothetical protein
MLLKFVVKKSQKSFHHDFESIENLKELILKHYLLTVNFFISIFLALCSHYNYPALRLDGSTSTVQRQQIVSRFNNPHCDDFVLLLSSKAGGTGRII